LEYFLVECDRLKWNGNRLLLGNFIIITKIDKIALKNVYFLLREQYTDKIKSAVTGNFFGYRCSIRSIQTTGRKC